MTPRMQTRGRHHEEVHRCPRTANAHPYADALEQGVAQGWLTGQETCYRAPGQGRATDLLDQEAAGSREVQAEMFGITGRCAAVLASRLPPGGPGTILEALTPVLEAHPGMWPGMALYWLRRQAASSRGGLLATLSAGCASHARRLHRPGGNPAASRPYCCPTAPCRRALLARDLRLALSLFTGYRRDRHTCCWTCSGKFSFESVAIFVYKGYRIPVAHHTQEGEDIENVESLW